MAESSLGSSDASAISATDPLLLGAEAVAVIALISLVFLQMQGESGEDEKNPKQAESKNAMASTAASRSIAPPSEDSPLSQAVSDSSKILDNKDGDKNSTRNIATAMSEELKLRPDDDLTKEEDEALASFDEGDRVGLFGSLGRLTGKIRWTRAQLQKEQTLRQDAESKLTEAGEEMRDLEDQYELGQNKLAATAKELLTTKSTLGQTQKELSVTSANLQELQEERKSLRKLGKVAWNLSKDRVQRRVRKIRGGGEEEGTDDTN